MAQDVHDSYNPVYLPLGNLCNVVDDFLALFNVLRLLEESRLEPVDDESSLALVNEVVVLNLQEARG